MPIYEYECDKCGHEFEREQRMSDAPVKTCPECKSRRVIKLISRSSFVLKGGGWYADGYADAKADGAKKDKDEKGDKGKGKDDSKPAKSDSKPAPDTKSKDSSGSKSESKSGDKSSSKGSSKSAA